MRESCLSSLPLWDKGYRAFVPESLICKKGFINVLAKYPVFEIVCFILLRKSQVRYLSIGFPMELLPRYLPRKGAFFVSTIGMFLHNVVPQNSVVSSVGRIMYRIAATTHAYEFLC